MSTSYTPLRDPDDIRTFPGSVTTELEQTRVLLTEAASTNIHDHNDLIRAAVRLEHQLRNLAASIEAERGERR